VVDHFLSAAFPDSALSDRTYNLYQDIAGHQSRPMKVLVCGGRNFRDVRAVKDALTDLHMESHITKIIEGGASGADCYAAEWADEWSMAHETFSADWQTHGRAAGPIRNQKMLDEGKPDLVLAFPGGRGTDDMVRRATAAGVRVLKPGQFPGPDVLHETQKP
jgi:hypothetical protein